jgi:hypothetical protein
VADNAASGSARRRNGARAGRTVGDAGEAEARWDRVSQHHGIAAIGAKVADGCGEADDRPARNQRCALRHRNLQVCGNHYLGEEGVATAFESWLEGVRRYRKIRILRIAGHPGVPCRINKDRPAGGVVASAQQRGIVERISVGCRTSTKALVAPAGRVLLNACPDICVGPGCSAPGRRRHEKAREHWAGKSGYTLVIGLSLVSHLDTLFCEQALFTFETSR